MDDLFLCVQCPATEPDVCVYVRVCGACQEALEERQVDAYRSALMQNSVEPVNRVWHAMTAKCEEFRRLETKIDIDLPEVLNWGLPEVFHGVLLESGQCIICVLRAYDM